MAEDALLVRQEARPHPVPHPLVLGLDEPVEAILEFLHAGHEELPLARGLRRPQIGRAVGQVDMIVAGDEPVLHGALLCSEVTATKASRARS